MQPRPPAPVEPVLSDGTVTLRIHRDSDLEAVVAQCRDPQMQRWTRVPVPYEERHGVEWIAARRREWTSADAPDRALAIELQGRLAGSLNLRTDGAGAASVGYGLAPWARGRGVTGRALALMLPWGFEHLDLDVVHWSAGVGNWASRRVAWRSGFRVEGRVRGWLSLGGRRTDAWVGSLRRGDPMEPAHPWWRPPVIEMAGLHMRAHRPADGERITEACADSRTRHWLPRVPDPYTLDDARAHLEHVQEEEASGRSASWAVADTRTDEMVAEVGLLGLGPSSPRAAEIGYWTHPGARGRGVATRALRAAARHALLPVDTGGLGCERVLVRVARGNAASHHVALQAGMRPAGTDRRAERLRDGTVTDLVRYDLLLPDLGPDAAGEPVPHPAPDVAPAAGPTGPP